ncbi:AAA family ATPase [Acinetobacter pittii]|uniref:AAA family ATPase n=1 Tax=Acinetobacter calcoaceticus/baumannii complex TaxID=909768 RepID=UPI00092B9BA8|nr:AAA family ATPase [Acinetobacter baumannii]OJK06350.1 AAA family ATPase [Acinetobacter baumannii]
MFEPKPYLRSVQIKTDLQPDWSVYPFAVPAVNDIEQISFHPDVTFFVGENGAGKSTILEAIALALGFSEEGGTLNVRLNSASSTSNLYQYLRTIKSFRKPKDYYFLRAESYYNVGTYMNELNYVAEYGGNIHARSHGEAFIKLLTQKFKGEGLYLMDEPEAALSPTMQMVALSAIHDLVQNKSQFIIATHSPILLAYPYAKIYQISDTGISQISYEQTEHFRVTKDFLNNYSKRIQQILEDD